MHNGKYAMKGDTQLSRIDQQIAVNISCYYLVFASALVVAGCTRQSARELRILQQIKEVNAAIDKWNPSNTRLARSRAAGKVKGSGFDFLLCNSTKDFPSLFKVADSDAASLEYHKEAIRRWAKARNHSVATKYLSFETNLWELGESSDGYDLLVVATVDDQITDWGLFANMPY